MPDPTRLVVQLSDPHIVEKGSLCVGRVDTAAFLVDAVRSIATLRPTPDLVLCTGDLVNDGRREQYQHLRELLGDLMTEMPLRFLPGNHDDRDELRAAFPAHLDLAQGTHLDQVIDLGGLRVVALDSLVPGDAGGDLRPAQIRWLHDALSEAPDRPTIVALHHPPFPTGIGHMDAMGLAGEATAELARIIGAHPQVERVVSGHLHRSITRRFAGTVAMIAPSVAHAVALDLVPGSPAAWTYEPPGLLLHHWTRSDGVVSHLLPVGDFPTHPFAQPPAGW